MKRVPKLDTLLQIEPELRRRAQDLFEAQRGVRSNPAAPVDDVVDAHAIDVHRVRELLLRTVQRSKEFFLDDLARRRRAAIGRQVEFIHWLFFQAERKELMVVGYLDLARSLRITPFEADAVLVVNSDRPLAFAVVA